MTARERRVIASAAVGGVVGGFATGEAGTWEGNLVTLVVWGSMTAIVTWSVLETVAAIIADRGTR